MTTAEPSPLTDTLRPTPVIDSDHERVRAFVDEHCLCAQNPTERAITLFFAVRDGVRYDPYGVELNRDAFKASETLRRKKGFCVPKAILLTAAYRAAGLPSRLGFADVRNHLSTPRLRHLMRTDRFVFHGYSEVFLEGRWVKATPAFDASLCEVLGVTPLDFDGVTDSVLQPANQAGDQYMEYLADRGTFDDFPLELMLEAWRETYPHFFEVGGLADTGDMHEEASRVPKE